jgi:hypothetical protein
MIIIIILVITKTVYTTRPTYKLTLTLRTGLVRRTSVVKLPTHDAVIRARILYAQTFVVITLLWWKDMVIIMTRSERLLTVGVRQIQRALG